MTSEKDQIKISWIFFLETQGMQSISHSTPTQAYDVMIRIEFHLITRIVGGEHRSATQQQPELHGLGGQSNDGTR